MEGTKKVPTPLIWGWKNINCFYIPIDLGWSPYNIYKETWARISTAVAEKHKPIINIYNFVTLMSNICIPDIPNNHFCGEKGIWHHKFAE